MASIITNRAAYLLLGYAFRGTAIPTNFYAYLCTNAQVPTVDFNTLSQLTEIASGNGYGEVALSPGATDFDVYTEDDVNDYAYVQLRDIAWTASGGPIPASGNGARWLVLTDDQATEGNRQIIAAWDLVSDRTVSDSQTLTIQNAEIRLATV